MTKTSVYRGATLKYTSSSILILLGALLLTFEGPLALIKAPLQVTGSTHDNATLAGVRQKVSVEETTWLKAAQVYKNWIVTNNITDTLQSYHTDLLALKEEPRDAQAEAGTIKDLILRDNILVEYGHKLYDFSKASVYYFNILSWYQDNLIGATVDLGTRSQNLDSATKPVTDMREKYPVPLGKETNYPFIESADVGKLHQPLITDSVGLADRAQAGATAGELSKLGDQIEHDATALRNAGVGVERMAQLHSAPDLSGDYAFSLTAYDRRLQAEQNSLNEISAQGIWLVINGLIYGGIALSGLVGLFALRRQG